MDRLQAIAGLGLPAAGQIVLEVGAFSVGTLMAGRLAPAALAAHQIALNCASLTYMVPLGLSAAAAVSVGHAQGAGDGKKAARAGWMAIGLGAGFMSLAMLAFLLAPRPIIEVYTRDAAVLAIGPGLLALAGTFQIFDGIQSVSTGALRGLGDTRTAMAANLFAYGAVGLPLGAFLCFVRGWGVYGIWTGLTVALMVVAGVVVTVWKRRSGRLAAACSLTG
jgi:MATE family multidrug resistance protein